MVQAMIRISANANQILNIVKAKYNLKDKSEAIEKVVMVFGTEIMEPALRPEFVEKMICIQKQNGIKVEDFAKRYGL